MGLGVHINRSRFIYLLIAVILAGFCVAIGGSIGFVGLPYLLYILAKTKA